MRFVYNKTCGLNPVWVDSFFYQQTSKDYELDHLKSKTSFWRYATSLPYSRIDVGNIITTAISSKAVLLKFSFWVCLQILPLEYMTQLSTHFSSIWFRMLTVAEITYQELYLIAYINSLMIIKNTWNYSKSFIKYEFDVTHCT